MSERRVIWQELIVEIQPIDSQESVIGVTSKFPGILERTDIFNRNQKQVDEFFILLDAIIERELVSRG